MYFMMPAQLAAKDAAFEVRSLSNTQADAVRADVLAYTGRHADARRLLQTVLRDDQDNVLAHETMGYLAYRAGDIDGARSWYSDAMELDSHSYLAQYYYAALARHDEGDAEDGRIEYSLRAAIRLNPVFAPAYDELAMLFALRNKNLDEAHALNLRAIELEPGRLVYRLNCAEVLAERRQFAEALEVLQSAMWLAKTPREVDAVTARVARVERYQMAMAGVPETRGVSGFGE
jgi:predicted Zn-dependent protease